MNQIFFVCSFIFCSLFSSFFLNDFILAPFVVKNKTKTKPYFQACQCSALTYEATGLYADGDM